MHIKAHGTFSHLWRLSSGCQLEARKKVIDFGRLGAPLAWPSPLRTVQCGAGVPTVAVLFFAVSPAVYQLCLRLKLMTRPSDVGLYHALHSLYPSDWLLEL